MTQQTELPPKLTEARKRSVQRWKLVERSFSTAAIIVVLFLGWSAIDGFQRLFSQGPLPIRFSDDETEAENQGGDLVASLAHGGYWQMASWRWEVGVTQVAAGDIEFRLAQIARSEVPTELDEHEVDAINQLMFALKNLPIDRRQKNGLNEYRIEQPDSKLLVVSQGQGQEEVLVAIGAAMRNPGSDNWTMFELKSGSLKQIPIHESAPATHLLPLPPTANRLCSRTNTDGQVLFELVKSPESISSLASELSTKGWEVKPFQPSRSGETSLQRFANVGTVQGYLCENDEGVVHVWNIPNQKTDFYQLAMVRVE